MRSVDRPASNKPLSAPTNGPFLAKVISVVDNKFMGNLTVQVLKQTEGGNQDSAPGQVFTAKYLSPFGGQTPIWSIGKNDTYTNSQQSYGMWMIPPDPGTIVLVIFAEGNINECFWIGCVQDEFMNFSLPGHPATTYTTDGTPDELKGKKLPVSEYNKGLETSKGQDPTQFLKPYQKEFTDNLVTQGLLEDETRGITSSSARREVPSTVFGISTPGPVDKRIGAPKGKVGTIDAQALIHRSRLGGSSFVMDDGNDKLLRKNSASTSPPDYANVMAGDTNGNRTLPHNELVRLKTRTGHQILLHNTEDLIYIANAKGNAWVELTADGKIDIYAKDSMSVHTETDLNLTADRDITMEAGANISIKASGSYLSTEDPKLIKGRIQIESAANTYMLVGANHWVTTIGNYEAKTNGETKITSGGQSHIKSGGNHIETAPQIHMNGPAASAAQVVTALSKHILPGTPTGNLLGTIGQRAPMHEPWTHHENLDPTKFKIGLTDRDNILTVITPEALPPTPDPFKKEG